jgi:ribosome-binding protein aMBF1 (putative translation factor)
MLTREDVIQENEVAKARMEAAELRKLEKILRTQDRERLDERLTKLEEFPCLSGR